MTKKITAAITVFVLVLSLCACGITPEGTGDETPGGRQFTDSAGRTVTVPEKIERIIPSGGLAQTFIWPMAADKLVSLKTKLTPDQLRYLGDEFALLPESGDLYLTGGKFNVEAVAALSADVYIDFGEFKDSIVEDLDELQELIGIPCVFIEGSFDNSENAYRMLGELLGEPEKAQELSDYIGSVLGKARDVLKRIDKKTLALCDNADGLGCIARGTFRDEIWSFMGTNVVELNEAQFYGFTTVNLEQLQLWDPEYLFFVSVDAYNDCVNDPAWSGLRAVQSGNCYTIPALPQDFCYYPSVNRYLGIIWLAEIMYPDEFDWDIKSEIYKFYRLFYNCDLNDELYDYLMSPGHSLP